MKKPPKKTTVLVGQELDIVNMDFTHVAMFYDEPRPEVSLGRSYTDAECKKFAEVLEFTTCKIHWNATEADKARIFVEVNRLRGLSDAAISLGAHEDMIKSNRDSEDFRVSAMMKALLAGISL